MTRGLTACWIIVPVWKVGCPLPVDAGRLPVPSPVGGLKLPVGGFGDLEPEKTLCGFGSGSG
jgi:hypothetical protein